MLLLKTQLLIAQPLILLLLKLLLLTALLLKLLPLNNFQQGYELKRTGILRE